MLTVYISIMRLEFFWKSIFRMRAQECVLYVCFSRAAAHFQSPSQSATRDGTALTLFFQFAHGLRASALCYIQNA